MAAQVGQRVELGRYATDDGERILFGQRVDGVVRVVDKPRDEHGRAYLVERGLTRQDELTALVADYITESERRGEPAAIVRVVDALGAGVRSRGDG